MDADLWRILVGLAWALHDRPADCIKRCALCGKLFLQKTKKRKDYCSRDCAVRAVDAHRKGTEKRIQQQRQAQERAYRKKVAGKLGVQPDRVVSYQDPGKKRRNWECRAEPGFKKN